MIIPRRAFVLTAAAALAVLSSATLAPRALTPAVRAEDTADPVDPIEDQALREEAAAKFEQALATFEKAFATTIDQAAAGGATRDRNLARAEVLLEKIDALAETTTKQRETDKFLATFDDDAKAGPLLRGNVAWRRARFMLAEGDTQGAADISVRLGLVKDWWVVGPFDNERGQGFKKAEAPEKKLDLAAELKGKDQHDIAWRQVPVKATLGYVDLDALMRPNDQAMAYAAAFVNSDTDRDAALRIGSDEAVAAWVNGAKVLSRDVRRTMGFDQDVSAIHLDKGWNIVLIKVCDQTGEWGFRARLTDLEGAPLAGLTFASSREDADAAVAAVAARPKPTASTATAAAGAKAWYDAQTKDKKAARDLFHLGLLHYQREFDSTADRKAENLLREASEAEPTNAIYRFHYAEAAAPPAESEVDKEENRQRAGREKALELDPNYAVAYRALASYYEHSLVNLERAEALLRKALAVNPDFVEARLDLADVLERRGLTAAGEVERKRALADARATSLETLARANASVADRRGMGRAAIDAWKEVLRLDARGNDVRRRVAELAAQAMAPDEAITLLDAMRTTDPYDTGVLRRKAQILAGRDDLAGAANTLTQALEIAPQDDELLADLGEIQLRQGAKDAALASFRRSLELNEKNAQLERYVEYLDPDAAPYEDDFAVELAPLLEKAAAWKNEENDGWLVVLDQSVTKVNRDGTSSHYVRGVARVLNDGGAKRFDRVFAQGWGQLKWKWARVTHTNGAVVEAKIQGRVADMDALKPGDVVDWAYRFDDREQSYFGDYFGDSFYFADQVPVLESRYTLLTPAEREFYFHQKNFDAKPDVTMRDDNKTRVYTWRNIDVAKIREEPFMPDMTEAAPQVQVTTYKDWDSFAAWWAALIKDQKIVTAEMKEKVAELTKGKEDRFEKIRAIYEFVTGEVTYQAWEFGVHGYKPYTTTQIFEKREGDCKDKALLTVALLSEIGVEAHPVLIKADQGRSQDDLTLALVQQFNHCIAYVPDVDGKGTPMFLDGTAQYHTASAPPSMDRGATVLIVTPEGGQIKTISPGTVEDFGVDQSWKVTVRDDGGAKLVGTFSWRGDMATQARNMFSVEGQRPLILQSILQRTFGQIKLEKQEFTDLKDLAKPIAQFTVTLDVPKFAQKSGESFTLPAAFFDLPKLMGVAQLATRPEREHDLILPIPLSTYRIHADYELPAGWTVESQPENAEVTVPAGKFAVTGVVNGSTISYDRVFSVTGTRVKQAEYGAFRDGLTKLAAASEQNFKVKKGAAEAAPVAPENK